MLVSYKWIKEFFAPKVLDDKSPKDIAAILVNQGLEVADIKYFGDAFKNVVIARVLSCEKHPNADKLSLCKISDGNDEFQVICGAKNVKENINVAFAKIGAILPGNFEIKKANLRGVDSFGMICSEKELGFAAESVGIWILPDDAKIGQDIVDFMELDDHVFEVEITPNRGDCLSVIGIAREIAAFLGQNIILPKLRNCVDTKNVENLENFDVEIQNKLACESYSFALVKNVQIPETPIWMKMRLIKCGLRPINPVVDITNYLLLELGHPMHAFDLEKLSGQKIVVKNADENIKNLALNSENYEMKSSDVVICDSEKPIAIAGIIGGENSCVDEKTKHIVFESAIFEPSSVRKTVKRLGISTDSSYRFERGVSYETKNFAILRAVDILLSLAKDAKIFKFGEINSKNRDKKVIEINQKKINKTIGKNYSETEILEIFERLNFKVLEQKNENFSVEIPDYRNDILQNIDLIEEIARLDGYLNIPDEPLFIKPSFRQENSLAKESKKIDSFKNIFVGFGFFEAINYPFISSEDVNFFEENVANYFEILNPLTETEKFMTSHRVLNLIRTGIVSSRRQQESVKIFEIGKKFEKKTNIPENFAENENYQLAAVLIGNEANIYWQDKTKKIDFYFTKGLVTSFFKSIKFKNFEFRNCESPLLDPQNSVQIFTKTGTYLGFLGKLSRKALNYFNVKTDIFAIELDLNILFSSDIKNVYKPVSAFPILERDLSLIMKKEQNYREVEQAIKNISGSLLKKITVFDIYEENPIPETHKNISIRLYFQSEEETLSDVFINNMQSEILANLRDKFDINLRP